MRLIRLPSLSSPYTILTGQLSGKRRIFQFLLITKIIEARYTCHNPRFLRICQVEIFLLMSVSFDQISCFWTDSRVYLLCFAIFDKDTKKPQLFSQGVLYSIRPRMLSIDSCYWNECSVKMSILLNALYLNFKKFIFRIMKTLLCTVLTYPISIPSLKSCTAYLSYKFFLSNLHSSISPSFSIPLGNCLLVSPQTSLVNFKSRTG